MFGNDPYAPARKARLAREAAAADEAAAAAEAAHEANVALVAEAIDTHGLLARDPGAPGEQGKPGQRGAVGLQGPPGPSGPTVVSAVFERGAYNLITGVLETLTDGTTRHFTVARVNGHPTDLRLDE